MACMNSLVSKIRPKKNYNPSKTKKKISSKKKPTIPWPTYPSWLCCRVWLMPAALNVEKNPQVDQGTWVQCRKTNHTYKNPPTRFLKQNLPLPLHKSIVCNARPTQQALKLVKIPLCESCAQPWHVLDFHMIQKPVRKYHIYTPSKKNPNLHAIQTLDKKRTPWPPANQKDWCWTLPTCWPKSRIWGIKKTMMTGDVCK